MTLDDVFGLQPKPSSAQPRRVEPLGSWPVPRVMTPGRIAQIQGMVARNKAAGKDRGEGNGNAKLTVALVLKVRALRAAGERPTVVAKRFNIDRTLVWKIEKRHIWSHV
jgi:hypothetical protein